MNGTVRAKTLSGAHTGSGSLLTGIGTASLGGITGSPSSTTYLAGDGTWATVSTTVPSGMVAAFNLTACPSGWTEYTPAYGRFIRGIDKSGSNTSEKRRSALLPKDVERLPKLGPIIQRNVSPTVVFDDIVGPFRNCSRDAAHGGSDVTVHELIPHRDTINHKADGTMLASGTTVRRCRYFNWKTGCIRVRRI